MVCISHRCNAAWLRWVIWRKAILSVAAVLTIKQNYCTVSTAAANSMPLHLMTQPGHCNMRCSIDQSLLQTATRSMTLWCFQQWFEHIWKA